MRLIALLLFSLFSTVQAMAAEDSRRKSNEEVVAGLFAKEEKFARLPLFSLFSTVQAMAAEDSRRKSFEEVVAGLIAKEEKLAKLSCKRIRSDVSWKKAVDALNEWVKFFTSISEKERSSLSAKYLNEYELKKSYDLYSEIRDEREAGIPEYRQALEGTRLARVLRMCGKELFRDGLLPPAIGPYATSVIGSDKLNQQIDNLSSELESHDGEWLEIARNSQGGSATEVERLLYLTTGSSDLSHHTTNVTRAIWFPWHDLYIDGDKLFASKFDYEKFKKSIDESIAAAVDEIRRNKERGVQEARIKKEHELRVRKVRSGDITAAKSCDEVALGLIGEKAYLSKDYRDVYVIPTNKIYAGIGKIIGSGRNVITVLDSDVYGEQFVFKLRYNSKTLWFGDKTVHGRHVKFVGRYVDNTTTLISQGGNTVPMPARVYDVVCIQGL